MNFLLLNHLSNRTGNSFLNTITGNMVSLSNRFDAVMANPFLKILSALYAELHITTFTITMVATDNTSAKSANRPFLPVMV